jgi:hypothetical protein
MDVYRSDLLAAGIDYQDAEGRFADFHALRTTFGTLLTRAVSPTTCFWLQDKWEKLGGGMARIHVFDSRLNAGSYILKRSGFSESVGGDVYESAKFSSKACELMLADRVWKVAGWRSGYETARLAPIAVIAGGREVQGVPDGRRAAPAAWCLKNSHV